MSSMKVVSVWPGHEPGRRDAAPLEQLEHPLRARPAARTPRGCSLTGGSPRRIESEMASWSMVSATDSRRASVIESSGGVPRPKRSVPGLSFGPRPRPPVSFALDGHHGARLLRDPRRRADRDRRRDQARLPQARPAVAPGRQQGPGRPGAVQGDQRGVPGPVRPGAPPALRHVRPGRRRWRPRRPRVRGLRRLLRHLRCLLRRRRRRRRGAARPAAARRGPALRPADHVRGGGQGHREGDRVPRAPAVRDLPRHGRQGGHRADDLSRSATAAARSAASARRCSARWST